jgi:hypothetical protein
MDTNVCDISLKETKMKTKNIQSFMKTAVVAVTAVLGTFVAIHAAKASDNVSFSQNGNGVVSCTSSSGSQTGSNTCSDTVTNSNAAGGETLSWNSVSMSPPANWLSVSPQSQSGIAPGQSVAVSYTVQSGLSQGTYSTVVTFNGQSNMPSGGSSATNDTVNVQFVVGAPSVKTPPGPPTNPLNQNSSANSAVACNSILLTWGAGQNADSYNVFRNGSPFLTHFNGLSYTDSSVSVGTSYSYTIQSYSASLGVSSTVSFSPQSIQATGCQVDLSLSDDLINTVNNQAYPYNSSCVGSQSGTATVIQQSELVELRINICNRGTTAAQQVVLSSNFDPTTNHTQFLTGEPGWTSPSSQSTVGSGTNVTWNVGTVNPNANTTIYVYISPFVGENPTQTLQRFINSAAITYTSAVGNIGAPGCIGNFANAASPCVVSTGYVPFTASSNTSASQQEIKP